MTSFLERASHEGGVTPREQLKGINPEKLDTISQERLLDGECDNNSRFTVSANDKLKIPLKVAWDDGGLSIGQKIYKMIWFTTIILVVSAVVTLTAAWAVPLAMLGTPGLMLAGAAFFGLIFSGILKALTSNLFQERQRSTTRMRNL